MPNELALYNQTRNLLRSEDVNSRFHEILGDRSNAFLASVLSVVYQSKQLQECDPQSVLFAAMKAAVLDLPVDPNIGQSAIIPYKGTATFQIMYKGLIRLALRSKEYDAINADVTYEGEEIKTDRLTGKIFFNGHKKSDKISGAFAYFKLKDGFEKYLYMTSDELEAHGKRYSPSYGYDSSLWKKDKKAMYLKTVLKQLLGKYGPLSVDVKKVLEEDKEPEEFVDAETREIGVEEPVQNAPTGHQEAPGTTLVTESIKDTPVSKNAAPAPSQPNDEFIYDDSGVANQPKPKEDFGVQMWQRLVNEGIIMGDANAKRVMSFYPGKMDWENVKPWALKVKYNLQNGDTLQAACNKANAAIKS